MVQIDLVYPQEDARSARLRADLRDALQLLELPPKWDEWEGDDPERPAYTRAATGPAVFLERHGVAGIDGTTSARTKILMALQEIVSRR
jgi:hypothetical protein